MEKSSIAVIILAAGMGTRMKSDKPKVLHRIMGKPMILYVVETASNLSDPQIIVVVGYKADLVKASVSEKNPGVFFALQERQLGTGHAVSCALDQLSEKADTVLVLNGDVPLISHETLRKFIDDHKSQDRDISILAAELENPYGYGRLIMDEKSMVSGIVEETDATAVQKKIRMVNTGIYCVRKEVLTALCREIKPENAQGEFYLTDIVSIGHKRKKRIGAMICSNPDEIRGINSCEELKQLESILS